MLHFEDPRLQPDTEPHPIVIIERGGYQEYPETKIPLSTKIVIIILILFIVGLFVIMWISGGAILGV